MFASAPSNEGYESQNTGYACLKLPNIQLLSGEYFFSVYILDETGMLFYDQALEECPLKIVYSGYEMGVYRPEHSWVFKEGE